MKEEEVMRVLIVGVAKSGTTGLCYRIANAMKRPPYIIFEPGAIRTHELVHKNIVAKMLTNSYIQTKMAVFSDKSFEQHFDKKVMIVRDPRDTVISWVLYHAAYHVIWEWGASRIAAYLDLLRQKERNPRSVPVLSLVEDILTTQLIRDGFESIVRFSQNRGTSYFRVRYEDFVSDKLKGLEKYLGLNLGRNYDSVLPAHHQRIVRSKSSGQWRSWFTEEDVQFFKPFLLPYMESLGYQGDWELHVHPSVLPIHASVYVKTVMNQYRKYRGLKQLKSV